MQRQCVNEYFFEIQFSCLLCLSVYIQGSSQPLLSHVALAVASKLTSALFSAARCVCVCKTKLPLLYKQDYCH